MSLATAQLSDCLPKMLTKSISEESFPSALLEDTDEVDFFDEKIVKDTKNEITKIREELEAVKVQVKTPPPSPELKIKPDWLDNQLSDHSTLLKVLRDEVDESNLSSMTPSLTELEAALSDMLETEGQQENNEHHLHNDLLPLKSTEMSIEPKIVPLIVDEAPTIMVNIDLTNKHYEKVSNTVENNSIDTPEKPTRMYKISLNCSRTIPIPPRRRNRSSSGISNDRLI